MANTYEYTGINNSATIVVSAGVDLGEANGKAVRITEGAVALPEAGDIPTGIILITEDEPIKKGDEVTIQVKDIGMWKAGGEFAPGDLLAVDAEGLCQKVSAGQYIFARALTGSAAKGDFVTVQIINAGYEKTA